MAKFHEECFAQESSIRFISGLFRAAQCEIGN